jgi:hypothetical protein
MRFEKSNKRANYLTNPEISALNARKPDAGH